MKKVLIIVAAAVLMPALLVLTALIPRSLIKENSLRSAQYLYEGELFGYGVDGVEGSRIDRYADAILLNIAYNLDSDYPLRSVMLSAYYFTPDHEENENYLMAVRDDPGINRQYLRYWHGSIALVRPLLTVLSVRGIYILNAVILVLLFASFIFMCIRSGEYHLATAYGIALVLTRAWFVPFSLEYTWMFMLMLVCSLIAIRLFQKGLKGYYGVFFMITGMVTAFLDFLTTETITLLMPLLILLWLERHDVVSRENEGSLPSAVSCFVKRKDVRMWAKCAVLWLLGYAGMWTMKWVMCSLVMKENAFPYVTEHVTERLAGTAGVETDHFIIEAITRNIACLFPIGYGAASVMIFIAIILFAAYRGFVYRRGKCDPVWIMLVAVTGLVPYIRYVVLHNHSYIHCFFTYRAQAASVAAVVLVIAALTERKDA